MSDRIDLLIRINQLEKALDKACCELSFMFSDTERNTWTQEKWKEWCMKDD